MRNPEQQVTPAMWCLWQLGPLYTGLAIWKSKLKEAQGLCISLDPRGSTGYSFLLFSWEVARKLVENCFCQRLKEKRERIQNKQNKTERHTHHKPIHQSPPGPYIWHFPQSFQDHSDHCVSTVFLAWNGLKWGLNVPALEKYLIFSSQGFFRYTIMRNDQAHISDLPEICLYYALRLLGLLKWGRYPSLER